MARYGVSLGSNLGDRLQHLVDAVHQLSERFGQLEVSALYETEPVGGPEQDPFLNAVAVFETDHEPLQVLDVCQEVETGHGRERKVRWGPRTLDVDIVSTDGPHVTTERLTIPHPRAAEREFVLRPLHDVWPDAPVGHGSTAASALEATSGRGVDRLATDWLPPLSSWKSHVLLATQLGLFVTLAVAFAYSGSLPSGGMNASRLIGTGLAFVGLVLAFVSTRRLGESITPGPVPKPGAQLVMSGPYRLARHPIYGGLSLFMIGTALVLDSVAGMAISLFLLLFFFVKARYEENQLRMRYAGYLAYKRAVPRWLIPFLV